MPKKTRRTRPKVVQVSVTEQEYRLLAKDARKLRTSVSGMLASCWLQVREQNGIVVPLSEEDEDRLIEEAFSVGVTPWELLIRLWYEQSGREYHSNTTIMKGRHLRRLVAPRAAQNPS